MGMALDLKEVERKLRQDWRERALKAEAEVARLTAEIVKEKGVLNGIQADSMPDRRPSEES